jgi:hypothetical protein
MSFERDMAEMVREADADESSRTLAMTYVRACGKLADADPEHDKAVNCSPILREVMLAQAPMFLQTFLRRPAVTDDDIASAIAAHVKLCGERRETCEDAPLGINWKQRSFSMLTGMRWPGAAVMIVYILKDGILKALGVGI